MSRIPHKTPPFGYFPRPEFTEEVKTLVAKLSKNVALFAKRRRGKTTWVLLELQDAAAAWGMEFAYINLWSKADDPVEALVRGLEIAAGIKPDDGTTRELTGGFSLGGFKIGAKRSKTTVTDGQTERLAAAMAEVAKKPRRTLLVIDEFQAIARADKDNVAVAAFRTALESHGDKIVALFTGSERTTLTKMFKDQTAPLLHQARMINLPEMGRDFVEDRAAALEQKHNRKEDVAQLVKAFEELGHSPLLMNDVIEELAARPKLGLQEALEEIITIRAPEEYGDVVSELDPLERALLKRVAQGEGPYKKRPELMSDLGVQKLDTTKIQRAVGRLEKAGLIEGKDDTNGWVVPDPLLQRWLSK